MHLIATGWKAVSRDGFLAFTVILSCLFWRLLGCRGWDRHCLVCVRLCRIFCRLKCRGSWLLLLWALGGPERYLGKLWSNEHRIIFRSFMFLIVIGGLFHLFKLNRVSRCVLLHVAMVAVVEWLLASETIHRALIKTRPLLLLLLVEFVDKFIFATIEEFVIGVTIPKIALVKLGREEWVIDLVHEVSWSIFVAVFAVAEADVWVGLDGQLYARWNWRLDFLPLVVCRLRQLTRINCQWRRRRGRLHRLYSRRIVRWDHVLVQKSEVLKALPRLNLRLRLPLLHRRMLQLLLRHDDATYLPIIVKVIVEVVCLQWVEFPMLAVLDHRF